MKKLKSLWLTITGSLSSIAPALFACCKSTACVGICASPVASLFGISTASIAGSPLMTALEPLPIAISAVSFTVSYYTLYVLPKFSNCGTQGDCGCAPSPKEIRKVRISKSIFWVGLIASVLFLGYFEYQKYQENASAANSCGQAKEASACCDDSSAAETISDSTSCSGSACCDTISTQQ